MVFFDIYKRKILFLSGCFYLLFSLNGNAQYQNFSQYNFTPDRINPGKYIKKDETALRLAYRNLNTNINLNMFSIYASGSYPLGFSRSQTGWGAINFSVFNDETSQSGLFKSTELALGYTHVLQLGKEQFLSFGLLTRYTDKGINLNNYTTGSQFNPGSGFDPSVDLGENFGNFQANFFSVGGGIYFKGKDMINKNYSLGFSLYDINRPNESVIDGKSALPVTLQAEGGYHIYEKDNWGILPSFLYTRSGGTDLLNIGSSFQYHLGMLKTVELLTRYKLAKSVVLGVQYHGAQFSAGFSYDIPTGIRNDIFMNAFEVGMEFRKSIIPKGKNRKLREKKVRDKRKKGKKNKKDNLKKEKKTGKPTSGISIVPNPESKENLDNKEKDKNPNEILKLNPELNAELSSPEDSLKTKKKDDLVVTVGKIEREKKGIKEQRGQFHFGFNEVELHKEAEQELSSWLPILQSENFIKLIIIGHTDNIGSQEINQQISLLRAESIQKFLVEKGIPKDKTVIKGEGKLKPVYENTNENGRAGNRRVELILITIDQ